MKVIICKIACGIALVVSMHQASAFGLAEELEQQDAEFFKRGFNECDTEYLQQFVSDDLVFYHDQGGLQNKSEFISNVINNICSNPTEKPIRKLVEGSTEAFPLHKNSKLYGAIQQGEHEFYIRKQGHADQLTSTAKFTHVWLKGTDEWLLSNVLSYDHSSPNSDEVIEGLLVDSKVPALGIGIIEAGKVKSINVYGERAKDAPADSDTIFKVASLTKPIVAFIALKLVDDGKLNLDEPLHRYWVDPDLKDDNRHRLLTVRHVLTHQTGFDNWRWMNAEKTLKFHFTPGAQHQYSGEGFEYLRKALERRFDSTIEELAQQYVFSPAGMTDTHFWWNDSVDVNRYAFNHDENGQKIELEKYYTANAAANLLTTVGDYTRFIIYIMEQSSKNPDLFNNIISKQLEIGENHHFGLGWEMFTGFSYDEFALLHTGKDPGVNALAMFFPNSKNGYVIFMNGDNNLPILEHTLSSLYLGSELWQRR